MKKIKITKEDKDIFFLALCVDIAFAFSIFVFIPYEVYLANIVDFNFSLNKFWMPMALGFIFGEYSRAAEPPVRCGESHLSGLAEPPVIYSYCI